MLLYQRISNLCNWKAAIYLSFAPKPGEKLKKSTRLIQIHKKQTTKAHSLLNQRKTFLSFPNIHMQKSSHGECCTSFRKGLYISKNTNQNLHDRKQPGP